MFFKATVTSFLPFSLLKNLLRGFLVPNSRSFKGLSRYSFFPNMVLQHSDCGSFICKGDPNWRLFVLMICCTPPGRESSSIVAADSYGHASPFADCPPDPQRYPYKKSGPGGGGLVVYSAPQWANRIRFEYTKPSAFTRKPPH